MENGKKDTENSGFGGILKGLKKLAFKDEYLESEKTSTNTDFETNKVSNNQAPVQNYVANAPSTQSAPADVEGMIKKIYGVLEKKNQPGIDFLELWNSAEAMGGATPQNLQNSFKALKIATGNTLTIKALVDSGEFYKKELESLIEQDIKTKESTRSNLVVQQQNDKQSLSQEVEDIKKQMQELQTLLTQKQQSLESVDLKYTPQIGEIEQKINVGRTALKSVLSTMQGVLDSVKKLN